MIWERLEIQDLDRYSRTGRKRRREEERYARKPRLPQVDAVGGKACRLGAARRMVYLLIRARLVGTYHRHPKGDVRLGVARIDGVKLL
jgi:hypothetical protein